MAPDVEDIFASYPQKAQKRLSALRRIILDVASKDTAIGPLTETVKWGEPAYLTETSKSGSTIRIAWKKATPERYGMYFNCNTNLVDSFRALFPDELTFEGNRAIIFDLKDTPPSEPIAACIALALTYHRNKKKK